MKPGNVDGKEIKAPYIPIYRHPNTLKGEAKKEPVELKIHFRGMQPHYPLKPKIFDSSKPSLTFELELKPDSEQSRRIRIFYKERDNYINRVLAQDPRYRDLVEEDQYRLIGKINKGKRNKKTGIRNNDYIRLAIEWDRGNRKWNLSLFEEGVLTDSPRAKGFIEDAAFTRYKCNIGVKMQRLTFLPATKNIYYKEHVNSINLPTKLKFETDQDRCLPDCRVESDQGPSTSERPNERGRPSNDAPSDDPEEDV